MGFDISVSLPVLFVFFQGLISFLSPCVLPLVPLYVGYLSGGTAVHLPDGTTQYSRRAVLINTLFFVLGISFAFFLLTLGFTALGTFFTGNQLLFARVGGILILLFGLLQLGLLGKGLSAEHRISLNLSKVTMNPLTALILGFTFSFAWTPCVGPTLASVLLMVSSAQSATLGYLLMGVYTLGFTLPFLAVGLFTSSLLNFFRAHRNVVAYTTKIGGALMVLLGVMMFTGWMNGITGYLSALPSLEDGFSTSQSQTEDVQDQAEIPSTDQVEDVEAPTSEERSDTTSTQERATIPAPDFTLYDQFGESHTLSDYQGQVVFLNFWASWCSPCRSEMPDIQALYENYGLNQDDVVILGVASPKSEENPYTSEGDTAAVAEFLSENSYTYPTVMDESGLLAATYGISAYPTTFMIDVDGNVYGYLAGMMTYDIMVDIITQTMGDG